MQKSIVRSLAVGALVLTLGLMSFGSMASAKTTKAKTVKTVKVRVAKVVKGHKRTLPGKVVSVTGTALLMAHGNKTYTIETAGVTNLVDRKGAAITLADIKPGHKISVRGALAGVVMSDILKLRDITLPLSTKIDSTK